MSRIEALTTPSVLRWAREKSNLSLEEASEKIKRPIEQIRDWEEGGQNPSIAQARTASEVYKRPLAVFFLPEPPVGFETLRDFRRLREGITGEYSSELSLLIRTTLFRQRWVRDFLVSEGEQELDFVGSTSLNNNPIEVAKSIKEVLNISTEEQKKCRTRTEARKLWFRKTEIAGVFILCQRGIGLLEARGFLVSDDIAPFIFVNPGDSKVAQIFSLAHELAHLWLNQSGVSNLEITGRFDDQEVQEIEIFSNKVAAELVLEDREFTKEWANCGIDKVLEDKIQFISNTFRVSEEVVARRLFNKRIISQAKYLELRRSYQNRWDEIKAREQQEMRSSSSVPIYYWMTLSNNGYAFTQTVISAFMSGKLPGRDASSLLNVKINNFGKLGEKAGIPIDFARGI